VGRTQGSETSQYLKEEKSIEIPIVAGWMCECGVVLKAMSGNVSCGECGRGYIIGPCGVRRRE